MEYIWSDLSIIERIYAIIGLAFSLFFLFQMIFSFMGGDHDQDASGQADSSVGDDSGISFQFITFKNMVAFFAVLGWSGLLCLSSGMATWLAVLISLLAGLLMMMFMASIFYMMSKLTDKGNINANNAIGKIAEVYLSIPESNKGQGKVSIIVQGRLMEYQAITQDTEEIKTGSQVKVLEIIGSQIFLVTKI